jgi:NADPH:quinone reductase-like Zn-dependent oxidoreductase
LGNLSSNEDFSNNFGIEGSGIVTAVGLEARRFRVGDRVAFNYGGSLSTSITLPETLCAKIPDTMTFEEAASIPYSYGTILYGLMDIGRLKKGQVSYNFLTNFIHC